MKITVVIASVLIGLGLLAAPASAQVEPLQDCHKIDTFDFYTQPTETIHLPNKQSSLVASRCHAAGVRIETVRASTRYEVSIVRREARAANADYNTPWLLCYETWNSALLVHMAWYTNDIPARAGEARRFNDWALAWKRAEGCIRPQPLL